MPYKRMFRADPCCLRENRKRKKIGDDDKMSKMYNKGISINHILGKYVDILFKV